MLKTIRRPGQTKLGINKETLRNLSARALGRVNGGVTETSCGDNSCQTNCPSLIDHCTIEETNCLPYIRGSENQRIC